MDDVIVICGYLRCAVCLGKKAVPSARPNAIPHVDSFNQWLGGHVFATGCSSDEFHVPIYFGAQWLIARGCAY